MRIRRLIIPSTICLLVLLLAFLGRNLWYQLRDLSTAGNENLQWTILQVDTEIANLHTVLVEQALRPEPESTAVRLRTDIALSRIQLVREGIAGEIFAGNAEAQDLLRHIDLYAAEAAAIVDSETGISASDVERLRELTAELRPEVRQLALLGLTMGAQRAEASRMAFARELRRTGLVAITVIGALTAVLVVLNRLLAVARQRDRALRTSSARLASTVAASLDAIVTADARGEIVEFNPAAEEIFGWSRDEILGRRLEDTIIAPRQPGPGVLSLVGAGRIEIRGQRRTGEDFPVEFNVTSVKDGEDTLFIAYLRDISEEKINQQSLIDAKEQAERTDRAKSQFLTIMSHEMRTPLNGILGVLDLLRTTRLTERQKRYVDVAAGSGEILLEHINEALDITRIETGAMTLSPQRFNLVETIEGVAAVLEPLARERGLGLDVEIEPGMAMDFVGDSVRIGQIVTNLIGNGIKFTEEGGITVRLSGIHAAQATTAKIAVRDTGAGIPDEHVEAIFEDFVALAHSEGRQARGDGLGLSISRKIARLMGGDLKVTSAAGEGSTFTLTLPLERAAPVAGTTGAVARRTEARPGDRKGRRVLVVEDNPINRSVLTEMLSNLGHDVHQAVDGQEGLATAEREPFDLIIMDISMPVMDGIEVVRRIRRGNGPNRGTHIQGLTAYGQEESRARAEAVGMTGFSMKPIRLDLLREIVEGMTVKTAEEADGSGDLDAEVVLELVGTLGPARTRETADRFFDELAGAVPELEGLSPRGEADEIAARLHKLRGAAALLGLRALSVGLDRARLAARAHDAEGYAAALTALAGLAAKARCRSFSLIASAATERTGS